MKQSGTVGVLRKSRLRHVHPFIFDSHWECWAFHHKLGAAFYGPKLRNMFYLMGVKGIDLRIPPDEDWIVDAIAKEMGKLSSADPLAWGVLISWWEADDKSVDLTVNQKSSNLGIGSSTFYRRLESGTKYIETKVEKNDST